jgi:hypothetical protein
VYVPLADGEHVIRRLARTDAGLRWSLDRR